MAMELQLSTQKAQQALKQVEQSLGSLQAAFSRFGSAGSRATSALAPLNNFKGPSPQAAASVKQLADAVSQFTRVGNLSNVTQALQKLGQTDIARVTQNVRSLSQALAQISVPPGLLQVANALNQVGTAARQASPQVRTLANNLAQIRFPTGLKQTANAINQIGRQSALASSQVSAFGNALNGARSFAAGFGVVLGGVGMANFVKSSYNAVRTVETFNAIIRATSEDVSNVGKELNFIRQVTTSLAIPVDAAMKSYAKLSAAMRGAGKTTEEVHGIFESFSTVFRVLNASQDQVQRGFLAIEQMYSKGSVSMEELRRQLGEIFPAFNLLAEGMGISTKELSKLIQTGQVDPSMITKLADKAVEAYGKGLPDALKSAQASLDLFGNAMFWLEEAFGKGFLVSLQPAINQLTKTLASQEIIDAARYWGEVAGQIGGALVKSLDWAIKNWDWLGKTLAVILGLKVADKIVGWASALSRMGSVVSWIIPNLSKLWNTASVFSFGEAVGGLGLVFAQVGKAGLALFAALAKGAAGFIISLGPVGWALSALIGLFGAAVYAFGGFSEVFALISDGIVAIGQDLLNIADLSWFSMSAFKQAFSSVLEPINNLWGLIKSFSSSVLDTFISMGNGIVQTVYTIAASFSSWTSAVWDAVASISRAIGHGLWASFKQLIEWIKETAKAFVVYLSEAANKAAQAIGNAVDSAISWVRNGIQSVWDWASAWSNWGNMARSVISGVTNYVRNLYNWIIDSIRALFRLQSQQSGGGGGSVDSYAGGGISGKGNGRTMRVDASAFVGAPRFATGGTTNGLPASLPGGGIPAVLHDNEAVVPLTGGGAIPVQTVGNPAAQGGGGISAAHLIKVASDTLYSLRSINLDVVRLKEAVHSQSVLMVDWFDKLNQNLIKISQNTMGGIGGGARTSGGGGGGGSLGSSGFDGGDDPIVALRNQIANMRAEKQTEFFKNTKGKVSMPGAIAQYWDGGYYDVRSNPYYQWEAEWDNRFTEVYRNFVAQHGAEALISAIPLTEQAREHYRAYEKMLKTGEPIKNKASVIGFATGSPNAWKDVQGGGFQAILHPDEAVIPLPDGRTVPVKLPDSIFERMDALSAQFAQRIYDVEMMRDDAFTDRAATFEREVSRIRPKTTRDRTDKHGGPSTIVVHMNIQTPDAASFRSSQHQIMQEFKSKLERSSKTIGNIQFVDDPTRPVGRE